MESQIETSSNSPQSGRIEENAKPVQDVVVSVNQSDFAASASVLPVAGPEDIPVADTQAIPLVVTEVSDSPVVLDNLPGTGESLVADQMPLLQVLEAILFSSDVPLSVGKLAQTLGLDSTKPVKQAIEDLNLGYQQRQAAYRIEERAGGYQILTLPQYAEYVQRLSANLSGWPARTLPENVLLYHKASVAPLPRHGPQF